MKQVFPGKLLFLKGGYYNCSAVMGEELQHVVGGVFQMFNVCDKPVYWAERQRRRSWI